MLLLVNVEKKIFRLQNNIDFILSYLSFVRVMKAINERLVKKKNIKFIRGAIDFFQKTMKMFVISFFQNLFVFHSTVQN